MANEAAATPVYNSFLITSPIEECLKAPADPQKDGCQITLQEASNDLSIPVERKDGRFQIVPENFALVQKTFPNFALPQQALVDYLSATSQLTLSFGTKDNPSDLSKKIKILTSSGEDISQQVIWNYTGALANFISHGEINPTDEKMKVFLTDTIEAAIYTFYDPVFGKEVIKSLEKLKNNASLSEIAKKRIKWLLMVYQVREKLWTLLQPKMNESPKLASTFKSAFVDHMIFLLANFILAETGYKRILSQNIQAAADEFHNVSSKDPKYHPSQNYYAYIKNHFLTLKSLSIDEPYQKDFDIRLGVLLKEYDNSTKEETMRLLASQGADRSWGDYLKYSYGETPLFFGAISIIVKNTQIEANSNPPTYRLEMKKISDELKLWVQNQPTPDQKKEALISLNTLLKELFERNGKMKIYWDKQVREVNNFYTSGNLSLVSSNKAVLEELILWARSEAKQAGADLNPGETPHVPLRKITLGVEAAAGALGLIAAGVLLSLPQSEETYYTSGTMLGIGGAGFGAAGGNLLSYSLNVNGGKELFFDLSGAALGGILASTLFFSLVPKLAINSSLCPPGDTGDCTKLPIDEYGRSIHNGNILKKGPILQLQLPTFSITNPANRQQGPFLLTLTKSF